MFLAGILSWAHAQPAPTLPEQKRALEDRAREIRRAADARLPLEQKPCYEEFLVNACLDAAKERNKAAHRGATALESEANALKHRIDAEARAQRRQQLAADEASDRARGDQFRSDQARQQAALAARKESETARAAKRAALAEQAQQKYDAKAARIDARLKKREEERIAKDARAAEKQAREAQAQAKRDAERAEQQQPLAEKLRRLWQALWQSIAAD